MLKQSIARPAGHQNHLFAAARRRRFGRFAGAWTRRASRTSNFSRSHAEPNPDFPNVPKNVANPENAAVFDAIIERAKQTGAELILATDPDCDRLGCAVPKTFGDPNADLGSR